jgi:hypothetical protein
VKLDGDTLSTVPDEPPAAGPDRALDPPLLDTGCPDAAEADVVVVAMPEPLLAVALTMPYAPPPIAMVVAPIAMDLMSFRENMD